MKKAEVKYDEESGEWVAIIDGTEVRSASKRAVEELLDYAETINSAKYK